MDWREGRRRGVGLRTSRGRGGMVAFGESYGSCLHLSLFSLSLLWDLLQAGARAAARPPRLGGRRRRKWQATKLTGAAARPAAMYRARL